MGAYISNLRYNTSKIIKIDYGDGVDITGWRFTLTLKLALSGAVLYTFETNAGDDTLDDPFYGTCYLTIPANSNMNPGKYFYELRSNDMGTPAIIKTILPPIDDFRDKIEVIS